MIDTDKYEGLTMNDMEHLELWELSRKLLAEVKRLREKNIRYLRFLEWLDTAHNGKKYVWEYGDEWLMEMIE